MEELFDILDENGNKTGQTKPRSQVHKDGDWHKSVHIWIVNEKNEILLQKRSPNKDSFPNMWDISSAGHLSAGDNSINGAIREIKEELGLDISSEQLRLIGTLKKAGNFNETFINSEFNDIYLLRLNVELNQITLQKEEVSEVKYVSVNELRNMINNRDKTLIMNMPGFKILFEALGVPL